MKFKYFLRGLGIGILFTSIVFFVANHYFMDQRISDKEIIKRAKELGLIEKEDPIGELLASKQQSEGSDDAQTDSVSNAAITSTREMSDAQVAIQETVTTQAVASTEKASRQSEQELSKGVTTKETISSKTTEQKKEEKDTTEQPATKQKTMDKNTTEKTTEQVEQKNEAVHTIVITVNRGDTSYEVCASLKRAGLIDNMEEYDTYLIENGYANRLRVGNFELKPGMTYEQIAKALVSTPD